MSVCRYTGAQEWLSHVLHPIPCAHANRSVGRQTGSLASRKVHIYVGCTLNWHYHPFCCNNYSIYWLCAYAYVHDSTIMCLDLCILSCCLHVCNMYRVCEHTHTHLYVCMYMYIYILYSYMFIFVFLYIHIHALAHIYLPAYLSNYLSIEPPIYPSYCVL